MGTTTQSRTHLENMSIDFDYPKPVELISYLIKMSTREDSIVLDSFAGSGTTGEAVLRLNKENNERRKFILIELEKTICKNITSERINKVIQGYNSKRKEKIPGLGGGYEYCTLDKKLFQETGQIEKSVTFDELATTNLALVKSASRKLALAKSAYCKIALVNINCCSFDPEPNPTWTVTLILSFHS